MNGHQSSHLDFYSVVFNFCTAKALVCQTVCYHQNVKKNVGVSFTELTTRHCAVERRVPGRLLHNFTNKWLITKNHITLNCAVYKHCKQIIALRGLLPVISMNSMRACKCTRCCTKRRTQLSRSLYSKADYSDFFFFHSYWRWLGWLLSLEDFVYSCLLCLSNQAFAAPYRT